MEIRVHRQISEVPEGTWDEIVPPNRLVNTHRYLSAVEAAGLNDCRFYYLVVSDRGRIAAHACVYSMRTELDTFLHGTTKRLITWIRRKHSDFMVLRTLECGVPLAPGNPMCFRQGTDERQVLALLASETERLARDCKIPVVIFRDFYGDRLDDCDALLQSGYSRLPNMPAARLRVRWRSFDEYVSLMRRKYRYRVLQHRRSFQQDGISVELLDEFSAYAEDLARLWQNVYDNAKEYRRERLADVFFENMDGYLRERSSVIMVKKDGVPVASMLLLHDDNKMTTLYSGLDYSCNREYCLYFNLWYETIAFAMSRGVERIDLGPTSLEVKKALGGTVIPACLYMKHLNPLLNRIVPTLFRLMTPSEQPSDRRVFRDQQGESQ